MWCGVGGGGGGGWGMGKLFGLEGKGRDGGSGG